MKSNKQTTASKTELLNEEINKSTHYKINKDSKQLKSTDNLNDTISSTQTSFNSNKSLSSSFSSSQQSTNSIKSPTSSFNSKKQTDSNKSSPISSTSVKQSSKKPNKSISMLKENQAPLRPKKINIDETQTNKATTSGLENKSRTKKTAIDKIIPRPSSKNSNKPNVILESSTLFKTIKSNKQTHVLVKWIIDDSFSVEPLSKVLEEPENIELNSKYNIFYDDKIYEAIILVKGKIEIFYFNLFNEIFFNK